MGVHGNADIGEDASEAYVRLHPDGTALLFSCLTEHGTGSDGATTSRWSPKCCNCPWRRISMTPADSLINPYEFGPVGSRGPMPSAVP